MGVQRNTTEQVKQFASQRNSSCPRVEATRNPRPQPSSGQSGPRLSRWRRVSWSRPLLGQVEHRLELGARKGRPLRRSPGPRPGRRRPAGRR